MLLCKEALATMFPSLKTLQVDNGVTSIQSCQLFPPVEELIVGSKQSPSSHDLFSSEQLQVIRKVHFEKMEFAGDKLVRLFRQFIDAPNLKSVKVDMDKANPKPILEPFLAANTPLEKLQLHNVTFDFGLGFLRDLEINRSLKKLVLRFMRINETAA